MPARLRVPLPCADLPELVLQAVAAVQAHASVAKQVRLSWRRRWVPAWMGRQWQQRAACMASA